MSFPAVEAVFRVGRKYRCHMLLNNDGCLTVEWEPNLPPHHSLSRSEMRDYRRGRDALVAEAASIMGGNALVVET